MSVVGIDFGYDTCYISVARAGGIETIANDYSMRDNPSHVAFQDNQRLMAVGAKNQLLTNLKRSFFGFKSLLGRKFNDPLVQTERSRLPNPIHEGPNNTILIQVNYLGKQQSFSPEQVTAMLFTKLKETADTALQTKVKDVVISVPVYYTDSERRAMLDAAAIAGLNVLKLMNDTTATALAYGIYKQDLPPTEEKARNVIFVDCGHQGVQIAAGSFNKGKLVMQSCAFDRDCSGRVFNEALAKYFAEDFLARYKVDAMNNKKALLKLNSELEKIKKQMSANTNRLPLNIECFMDDKDVQGGVDRATFEELIAPQMEKIEKAMRDCLASSKWKPEDIYAVEIVGGSTRVPAVKALIEKVFGQTPKTTLNADEAVSRGCALQCAILSPTFKVREFSVTDIQPYPVKLCWQQEDDQGDMVVFPQFHAVPFSKMLTFYRRDNFVVEGVYDGSAPIQDQHIGNFEIGEVKPTEEGANQKVKVKVRINLNGIFTVASASLIEKHEVEEEVPMDVDTPKDGDKDKKSEDAAAAKEDDKSADVPMDSQDNAAAAEDAKDKDESKTASPPKTKLVKKTVNKTVDLPITSRSAGSLSRDKLDAAIDLERSLVNQDRQESERLVAKNAVEEYMYDIRSKIFDDLEHFVTDDDRSALSADLEKMEDWLYEDGENCEKNVYEEKLRDIKLRGEPIKKRRTEFEARPAAIEALGRSLQITSKAIDLFRQGDEKYDHLDKAEVEKAVKQMEEKRKWLDESCATLNKVAKTVNPPILAVQFYQEKQALESVVNPILNKSKPKVEPPPQPPKDEKADKKDGGDAEADKKEETKKEGESAQDQTVNGGDQGGDMDLD